MRQSMHKWWGRAAIKTAIPLPADPASGLARIAFWHCCLLPVPWRMERIVFKAGRESLLTRWYPDACAAERRVCMVQCCQKRNKWYTLGTCASWLSATRQSTLARLRRHLPPDETPSSSSRPPLAVRLWVCMVQCCQKRNKRPLSFAHVHLQPCHL